MNGEKDEKGDVEAAEGQEAEGAEGEVATEDDYAVDGASTPDTKPQASISEDEYMAWTLGGDLRVKSPAPLSAEAFVEEDIDDKIRRLERLV